MRLKDIVLSVSLLVMSGKALAIEKPFLTTPFAHWGFIQFGLVKACVKNDYRVKSVIAEKNQVICFKTETLYDKEVERNIKLLGSESMIGYLVTGEQWLETEDINGNIKIISINNETNNIYIKRILDSVDLN